MASKHAARLSGDEYQHLYSWWLLLGLKLPDEHIKKVIIENGQAGKVDDVTVHYEPGFRQADRYYQVKYHVDSKNTYTAERFQKELLENFWRTWHLLCDAHPSRRVELYLVSNCAWERNEQPTLWIDEATGRIDGDEFLTTSNDVVAKIRTHWQQALGADDEEFKDFISSLYLRLQYSAPILKYELITERMKRLRLKTDMKSLVAAHTIVCKWIKDGKHEIELSRLEAALREHDLYLPQEQDCARTFYLETIEKRQYARKPDYQLDWTEDFVALNTGLKGYQLKNFADWNAKLLPQLYAVKKKMLQETACCILNAYGQARLSAWFAFGYVFSEVAGYTIRFDRPGTSWRTDTPANENFSLHTTSDQGALAGETLHGEGNTVAVGISITPDHDEVEKEIRTFLSQKAEKTKALLFLASERLHDAGDATALANRVKTAARSFVKNRSADRLLLFYMGPKEGACFIGHKLNKVAPEVQIMEFQNPGYAPTFLFSDKPP